VACIQIDLQLESGEYFLKAHQKEAKEAQRRKKKVGVMTVWFCRPLIACSRIQQEEVTDKRRAERAEAFVPPKEDTAPTVEEKKKRKRKERAEDGEDGEKPHKSKKKKKATEGDS